MHRQTSIPTITATPNSYDLEKKDYSFDLDRENKPRELGTGSYGTIYSGTFGERKVALKKSKVPSLYNSLDNILKAFQEEQDILRKIEEGRRVADITDQGSFNCLIQYFGTHTFT